MTTANGEGSNPSRCLRACLSCCSCCALLCFLWDCILMMMCPDSWHPVQHLACTKCVDGFQRLNRVPVTVTVTSSLKVGLCSESQHTGSVPTACLSSFVPFKVINKYKKIYQ
jgi:hypothetical protein